MRIFYTFLTILFTTGLLIAQPKNYLPGELLVQLKAGHTPSEFVQLYASSGMSIKELVADQMNIWLIGFDEKKIEDIDALELIKANPEVKAAQFNHFVTRRIGVADPLTVGSYLNPESQTPNDTRFAEQWGMHNTGQSSGTPDADIDAPEAWDFGTGGVSALGDTVVVAVVDGGFDLTHQDLNYYKNWRDTPGNGIDDDYNGYIDDYNGWNAYDQNGTIPSDQHGTHVAGIVGARGNNSLGVAGVNWNVKVMPVAGSSNTESIVLRAYNYILKMRKMYNQTNGASGAFVVSTNASFGVDFGQPSNYPLWCAVYDSLGMQGILSCGATANANTNVDLQGDIPTACGSDFMVAVTNTTRTDTKNSGAAYGLTTIDLGAPGTQILSTVPSNGYSSLTGTSMATPMVSGAIGLMFATANAGLMSFYKANPAAGALQFKQFLLDATDPIPALQNITVSGGRLNIYNALLAIAVPPDTVPPTVVNDLAASGITSSSITLHWTTPLDTTRNGIAGYDIRYAVTPITDLTTFLAATQVAPSTIPDTAGSTAMMMVDFLSAGTQYYFALRAYDLWANFSQISNVVTASTWQAPAFTISPDSMFHYLSLNESVTDSFIISNISQHQSTLSYEVSFENNTFPSGSVKAMVTSIITKEIDTRVKKKDAPPVEFGGAGRGSGGPDAFGYTWIDSDEQGGPQFVWNDIAASGTELTSWLPTSTFGAKDEGYSGPVTLPFNFKFYGNIKNAVFVSSNGMILFEAPTANNFSNVNLPSAAAPNNIIAPCWDDLDGTNGGKVYTKQEGSTFIIQYNNWPRYSTSGSSLTFQVVLHQNGKIVFYYKTMTSSTLSSATVGVENETGSVGLPVAYNSTYIKNNHAVSLQAEPEWLQTGNLSGILYNGNTASIQLTFASADYPEGMYSMDMRVQTNDPTAPVRIIPVRMWASGVVPVELTSFRLNAQGGEVQIQWSTASEVNNEGFIIERKRSDADWVAAGSIAGKGTSTERNEYLFKDSNLRSGFYFYRLVQKDFDGKVTISAEGEVEVGAPVTMSLEQNYPNPFNPSTVIKFAVNKKSAVRLEIFNSLGEYIETLAQGEYEPGYYETVFNGAGFSAGVYFYQLRAGDFVSVKKLLLIK